LYDDATTRKKIVAVEKSEANILTKNTEECKNKCTLSHISTSVTVFVTPKQI